jgi:SAM-dependent methyltransferase
MTGFDTRDPLAPEFWSERFERQFTPWDQGGVPAALQRYVARADRPRRVLIPGCGTAHELHYFRQAGWDAIAIDFSPAAVAAARACYPEHAERIVEADFFRYQPPWPVDLIYERAFLCALPPSMRVEVARRWAELLAPGGLLAGLFFLGETLKGPPFGIDAAALDRLLDSAFAKVEEEPVNDSIPIFAGREFWQVWRRL